MSYFTRKKKVSDIAKEEIVSATGVSIQAWGSNLDDINLISNQTSPGHALIINPSTYKIDVSPFTLGNAAYKNTGTSVGSVVVVQSDGKISPSILPDTNALDGFWKNLDISTDGGVHVGDASVVPDEAEQPLSIVAGTGVKLTTSNATLNKSIKIELVEPNNIGKVAANNSEITAAIPGDTLTVVGINNVSVDIVNNELTVGYTGQQFTSINTNLGQVDAITSDSIVNVVGGTDIITSAVNSDITVNYTGRQWKTLDFKGYNYNLIGTGMQTAQTSTDKLEIKAGFGIAIESDATTKKLTIRSQYLEGLGGVIDGGDYGELYDGFTYDGGTYYAFDGGTY